MDFFLSRYRHLTVLLIVITAQLLLIAYQVRSNRDVPLIRVWAVTAVTPVEQGLELVRRYTWGFVEDYFVLLNVHGENVKLQRENGQLKIENNYLKNELATADRARALSVFRGALAVEDYRRARHRQRHRGQLEGGVRRPRVQPAELRAAWRW